MRGINPKAWFYDLRAALVGERNRPCILAGAACEQWINAELFRVIATHLTGTALTAYPEWHGRRHDIAVLHADAGKPAAWLKPVAIVECKVVYLNYSPTKRRAHIARLVEQLAVHHEGTPERIGYLFGIYAYWPQYRPRPPKESFTEFRRNVGDLLREQVASPNGDFTLRGDHQVAMETLITETESMIGAAKVTVGCVAQYIRLRKGVAP